MIELRQPFTQRQSQQLSSGIRTNGAAICAVDLIHPALCQGRLDGEGWGAQAISFGVIRLVGQNLHLSLSKNLFGTTTSVLQPRMMPLQAARCTLFAWSCAAWSCARHPIGPAALVGEGTRTATGLSDGCARGNPGLDQAHGWRRCCFHVQRSHSARCGSWRRFSSWRTEVACATMTTCSRHPRRHVHLDLYTVPVRTGMQGSQCRYTNVRYCIKLSSANGGMKIPGKSQAGLEPRSKLARTS